MGRPGAGSSAAPSITAMPKRPERPGARASAETAAPTPAVALAQNPDTEIDGATWSAVETEGRERSRTMEAILGGMARAQAEGLPEGSYQVAQAQLQGAPFAPPAQPAPSSPPVPNSAPGTSAPQIGPAANDNVRPRANRVARTSWLARMMARLGLAAAPEAGAAIAGGALPVGVGTIGISRAAGRAHQAEHGGYLTPFLNIPVQIGTPPLSLPPPPQLTPEEVEEIAERARETMRRAAELEEQSGGELDVTIDITTGTVRITRTEEEEEYDPCEIGPYSQMSTKCARRGGQAHHIVPDYALRYGPRPTTIASDNQRVPNAPSLRNGASICLSGHARVEGGEHHAAHALTDVTITGAGAANTVLPGTTTWRDVETASLLGIEAAKSACLAHAEAAILAQFGAMPRSQILRGVINPNALSADAKTALASGSRLVDGVVVPPGG